MIEDNHEAGPEQGEADSSRELLSSALENTLNNLNTSIERMESIVRKFENGEADLDESISLLSEANELAVASSKELDQAVQKVVYDADDSDSAGPDESVERQEP
ncbi:MAG: exodeoxyribonuclease VII small subunit [Thermoleophilia bacterium]